MRIQVHFNQIQASEAVEEFIKERLFHLLDQFDFNPEDIHADIYLRTIRGRTEVRHPLFECELVIRPAYSKSVIKIIRKEENLYKAILDVLKSLKGAFAKRIAMRNKHRRRQSYQIKY